MHILMLKEMNAKKHTTIQKEVEKNKKTRKKNEEEKQNMQNQNNLLQNLFISYIVASDVLW